MKTPKFPRAAFCAALLSVVGLSLQAADEKAIEPVDAKFRVLGFFDEEQVDFFKSTIAELEGIELVDVNYEKAEATLRLSDERFIQKGDLAKQVAGVNTVLRPAARSVFIVMEPDLIPLTERSKITLPIAGLDCRGCSYGAYLCVNELEGVSRATADFGEGHVIVHYDPDKITPLDMEAALAKKSVTMNYHLDDPGLVPVSEMSIVRVSSEERASGRQLIGKNAIDGDVTTKWKSSGIDEVAEPPHELVIDLGKTRKITGFRYLAEQLGDVGQFAETEFYVSEDPESFGTQPAAKATFGVTKAPQAADVAEHVSGRYVMVKVLSEINGKPNATAAEIGVVAE